MKAKRIVTALLSACMIVGSMPQAVWASENETAGSLQMTNATMEGVFANGGIPSAPKKSMLKSVDYDDSHNADILKQIKDLQQVIDVTGYGITKSNVSSVMTNVVNSDPEIFYLESSFSYYTDIFGNVTEIVLDYIDSRDAICRMQEEVDAAADDILCRMKQRTERMSDEEIALLLHDYLASTIVYPYDDYVNRTEKESVYNIYGALVEHEAVCQGYALAYQYLLEKYGIDSAMASSKNINHAWNVVKINGKWYQTDVTWDDPTYDNLGTVYHSYFLLSDHTLFQKSEEDAGAQGGNRRDYIVTMPEGQTYETAVSTNFENGFWKDSSTSLYYYGNNWYYENYDTENKKLNLIKYNYNNRTSSVIQTQENVFWEVWDSEDRIYSNGYSQLAGAKDILYYSMPDEIVSYSLSSGKSETVLLADTSAGYIYGMGIKDDVLMYVLDTAPHSTAKQTYLATNISMKEHNWEMSARHPATCQTPGSIVWSCTDAGCGQTWTETLQSRHKWNRTGRVEPTCMNDGKIIWTCTKCGETSDEVLFATGDISGCTLTVLETCTYNGWAQRPRVALYDGTTLIPSGYYSVRYSNNVAVGTATVEAVGEKSYGFSGSVRAAFQIKAQSQTPTPSVTKVSLKKQKISSLKSSKKRTLTVKYKKANNATGYEIRCSTSRKFPKSKTIVKKVSGKKNTKKTISKLKSKKIYYVKVRSYKKINKTYSYGKYSGVKKIKVK